MDAFHEMLIGDNRQLLEKVWNHPFVARIASGTLPEEDLHRHLSQTYLFLRNYEQILCQLAVRAPESLGRSVLGSLHSIRGSMELFEELVARTVSNLMNTRMSFACHAYAHFMLASAHVRSFEESIVACYGSDYASLRTWLRLGQEQSHAGVLKDIAALLNQPGFATWLNDLAGFIDRAAETASPQRRLLMAEMFPIPIHYLMRYLDGLLAKADW